MMLYSCLLYNRVSNMMYSYCTKSLFLLIFIISFVGIPAPFYIVAHFCDIVWIFMLNQAIPPFFGIFRDKFR